MAATDFPSTLTGEPILALAPPGTCQFTTEFTSVPLLKRWEISSTSFVLRFGLPDGAKPLNLSTCACILAKHVLPDREGKLEGVIRPYTPISTNSQIGSFDLLIKNYGENGRMSTNLGSLKEGAEVSFKHIDVNIKIQAPFPCKKLCMLVGGTGITPMVQALHAVLGDPASDIEVTMLYGSRDSKDILGQDLLDSWSKQSDRLSVTHILSHEPEDSEWGGAVGYISKEVIEKHLPPPEDKESIIFICGPPPMYNALCGSRDEKELSGLLKEIGYSAEQVYKF
jgi:cytochrome-b5 reductase